MTRPPDPLARAQTEQDRRSAAMVASQRWLPEGRQHPDVISRYWQLNDAAWLRAQYLGADRTLEHLAGEIGCHDSTLRAHLARHGIRKHHDIDETWLRHEYVDRGRTQQDLADELGVNVHVIARARERFGIEAPDRRQYEQLHDGAWLRQQLEAGRSHRDIAGELGCSKTAVTKAARRIESP